MLHRVFTAGLLVVGLTLSPVFVSAADAPRPFLGVMVGPTQAEKDKTEKDKTPVIRGLEQNGPAAKAGLQKGDVILKVDKTDVKTAEDVIKEVAKAKPGDKLPIVVNRNGKEETFVITVGERPREPAAEFKRLPMVRGGGVLGVWTQPVTPELKEKMGLATDKGVMVMDVTPDSPAAKAGVVKDDIITAVNDQPVTGPEELRTALHKIGAGHEATLKVMRGKETKEIKAQLSGSHFGSFHEFPQLKEGENVAVPPAIQAELQRRLEEMEKLFRELIDENDLTPAK